MSNPSPESNAMPGSASEKVASRENTTAGTPRKNGAGAIEALASGGMSLIGGSVPKDAPQRVDTNGAVAELAKGGLRMSVGGANKEEKEQQEGSDAGALKQLTKGGMSIGSSLVDASAQKEGGQK